MIPNESAIFSNKKQQYILRCICPYYMNFKLSTQISIQIQILEKIFFQIHLNLPLKNLGFLLLFGPTFVLKVNFGIKSSNGLAKDLFMQISNLGPEVQGSVQPPFSGILSCYCYLILSHRVFLFCAFLYSPFLTKTLEVIDFWFDGVEIY